MVSWCVSDGRVQLLRDLQGVEVAIGHCLDIAPRFDFGGALRALWRALFYALHYSFALPHACHREPMSDGDAPPERLAREAAGARGGARSV